MTIGSRLVLLGASALLFVGSDSAGAASPDARPDAGESAVTARCVERLRNTSPHTIMQLRQILRVKTDEQAYPIICRKIRKGLDDGRISVKDLSWSDGMSPMSLRLIRVLQGK